VALRITRRSVGKAIILDLDGKIDLGESSISLREAVRDLLSLGVRNIVLNMRDVSYIDSGGFGTLVAAFHSVLSSGGRLKLVAVSWRPMAVLQITKMDRVIDIYNDEDEALRSFQSVDRHCLCPFCGSVSGPPLSGSPSEWFGQTCANCECRFKVVPFEQKLLLQSFRIETYKSHTFSADYIEVLSSRPVTVQVAGRLDLFSSGALPKLWRIIPKPRKVLFVLNETAQVNDKGRDALITLLAKNEEGDMWVVSLEGLDQGMVATFPAGPPFYTENAAAVSALGDVSDTPAWLIETV
jgi:anti-sigma B factor antagonist